MVADKFVLCNLALSRVGASPITAFDGSTQGAISCALAYDLSRRAILRLHPWNCAIDRVILEPKESAPDVPVEPAFGYGFVYDLPATCLRVLSVNDNLDSFSVEALRLLYTDDSTVELVFIKDEEDTTKFDSLIDELIAAHLAWSICYRITQSNSLRKILWDEFKEIKRQVKSIDGQEGPVQQLEADYFIEARLFGGDSAVPMRNYPEV
jgi:hypothetical protein